MKVWVWWVVEQGGGMDLAVGGRYASKWVFYV